MGTTAEQTADLPPDVLERIRRAEAETHLGTRQHLVKEACAAVEFPQGRIYPLPSELTPAQRALAERLADVDVDTHPYAMPSRPLVRRRWLGLQPAGALDEPFGVEPLWRVLQRMQAADANVYDAAKVVAELMNTMPMPRRLRVFADLFAVPEPAAVYDIDAGILFAHGGLRLLDDIDGSHGAWASAEADRLLALDRPAPSELRAVVFLALARAKVPIAPRWDVLLPVVVVGKRYVAECVDAIPKERQGVAVAAALRTSHPSYAVTAALDLLEDFPFGEIVDAYFDVCAHIGRGAPIDMDRLERVAKKHATVRTALEARTSGKPKSPKKKAIVEKKAAAKKKTAPKKKAASKKKPAAKPKSAVKKAAKKKTVKKKATAKKKTAARRGKTR